MSGPASVQPDPSMIGGISKAPFVLLPDAPRLFQRRADRFEHLAQGGPLAAYLRFLARLTRAQAAFASASPRADPISAAQLSRARDHAMPPLDPAALANAAALASLRGFFASVAPIEKPPAADEALDIVRRSRDDTLTAMIGKVVADTVPSEELAAHLYVAAGAQVLAAKDAGALDPGTIVPLATGVCPACGGRPLASVIVGFLGAEGARYGVCALCGTCWNEVRVKCLGCGSTKGVGYRAAADEEAEASVKAEVCDECGTWLKILYQSVNPSLEAVADDVASLGLDMLMGETAYARRGTNPFVLGY